jgi:hypothetical protein
MENRKSRGAQPGNTNSLKHGFYSTQFQKGEQSDLRKAAPVARYAGLQDEIDLIRVFLRRTIEAVNAEQAMPVETRLRALDVISKAAARLAHLTSVHHLVTVRLPTKEEQVLNKSAIAVAQRSVGLTLKVVDIYAMLKQRSGQTQYEKDLQLARDIEASWKFHDEQEAARRKSLGLPPAPPDQPIRPRHKKPQVPPGVQAEAEA